MYVGKVGREWELLRRGFIDLICGGPRNGILKNTTPASTVNYLHNLDYT